MKRFAVLVVLGGLGLLATPAAGSAQPVSVRVLVRFPSAPPLPMMPGLPSNNPLFYVPKYYYSYGWQLGPYPSALGPITLGYRSSYYGLTPPAYPVPPLYLQSYRMNYGGSYSSGSDYLQSMQRDLAKAQKYTAQSGPSGRTDTPPKLDQPSAGVTPGASVPPPPVLAKGPPPAAKLASGEALNELLDEIDRLEGKGATATAPFVSPALIADARFGGTPTGELLDLSREADPGIEPPAVFKGPALASLAADLLTAFAPVGTAVRAGKETTRMQIAQLESALGILAKATNEALKDPASIEARAARRFLDRFTAAVTALKAGKGAGLVDQKWSTEGSSVNNLVNHMKKNKLRFGPAPTGGEESYQTLYRDFATYLYALALTRK